MQPGVHRADPDGQPHALLLQLGAGSSESGNGGLRAAARHRQHPDDLILPERAEPAPCGATRARDEHRRLGECLIVG